MRVKAGLEFDQNLTKKYPEINDSTAEKNGGLCSVFFMDFEDEGEMRPISLSCGHQFSACAWTEHLKSAVNSNGEGCVMARCQQTRCNLKVPHSLF